MEQLHTSTVTPDQIDHLGHMNVRFYTVMAGIGAQELITRLGLGGEGGREIRPLDIHVRHHHEQLVGARLEVRGGVLDARPDRLRIYEELANLDSGELAATFVIGMIPLAGEGRRTINVPESVLDRARERTVEIPDHGRARSISFDDDPAAAISAPETCQTPELAQREVRVLQPGECEDDGWYRTDTMMELVWGGVPLAGRDFQPFHYTPEGRTMGWATMETRSAWLRVPRVGDRVQSFAAETHLAVKTMTTRHWVCDVDRSEPLCIFSIVNLAFDLAARRSMPIPDALRAELQGRIQRGIAAG